MRIPDKFSSRSLCHSINIPKLKASDFVLLDKRPTNESEEPYCYAPIYLTIVSKKLFIDNSSGPAKPREYDHAVRAVAERDQKQLNHILDALRKWRPQP
jgi:hypothetical protein